MRRAATQLVSVLALSACSYDFDGAFAGVGAEGGQSSSMGGSDGGSGGSGGTGGGVVTSEQCFNGTDDDGDELVDCADPECRGAICAPAAPEGWSGPAPLYLGGADRLPSCPSGLTPVAGGTDAIDAPAASCAACDCSPPSGGTCGIGTTILYASNTVCSGAIDTTVTPPNDNDCEPFTVGDASSQALGEPIPVDPPGSCQPSGGTATVPPAAFAEAALLCAGGDGAGCGGDVCVPEVADPFVQLCVFADGDVACPTGPYSDKRLLHTGIADDRGCSDCGCAPATGQVCTGTTELHGGSSCGNLKATVPHDGMTCESFDVIFPTVSAIFIPGPGPTGGTCSTNGGDPKGAATATDPITICCQPAPGAG